MIDNRPLRFEEYCNVSATTQCPEYREDTKTEADYPELYNDKWVDKRFLACGKHHNCKYFVDDNDIRVNGRCKFKSDVDKLLENLMATLYKKREAALQELICKHGWDAQDCNLQEYSFPFSDAVQIVDDGITFKYKVVHKTGDTDFFLVRLTITQEV